MSRSVFSGSQLPAHEPKKRALIVRPYSGAGGSDGAAALLMRSQRYFLANGSMQVTVDFEADGDYVVRLTRLADVITLHFAPSFLAADPVGATVSHRLR